MALSIGVYALWFGFIEKKPVSAPAQQRAVSSAQQPAAPAPPPSPSDRETLVKESWEMPLDGQRLRVHPRGAAVVSSLYQGPLGAVELVDNPRPGLLATWPELTFIRDGRSPGLWRATTKDGLQITKEFIAQGKNLPLLRVRLENPTRRALTSQPWTVSLGPGLGTVSSEKDENPSVWRALGLAHGQGGLQGKIETFNQAGRQTGSYRWAGVDNRYFLAAVVIPEGSQAFIEAAPSPPQVALTLPGAELAPGQTRTWEIPFYLGAKGNNILTPYGVGLERSINFGFFAQLGRGVLWTLGRIHSMTGNWGWSIIALTVLIQLLLFPLTYKSLRAAAAMKKLQPELAKLQQKYSKDPARLNTEMMELYKRSGANPLGGCLPMLAQMPVFIALYNSLRNSWELHGAPWIFWVADLSAKDPYYVLPIVMGALMIVQQKLSPAPTADPAQAKMMTWMPVLFVFMFLKAPSGLVLYWLTNSFLSVLQQWALKNHFERHP